MKLLKNFFVLTGGEVFCKILIFAAYAQLARILGPAHFGSIEWIGVVVMCAGLLVDQGLGLYGSREIAKNPSRTQELLAEIVGARIWLAFIGYGLIALIAFTTEQARELRGLLLLYGLSLFFAPFFLGWVFQGYDRMNVVTLIQIVRQLVFSAIVLIFATTVERLWTVAVAEIVAVMCAAVYGIRKINTIFSIPLKIKLFVSENTIRQSASIGLSQIFYFIKMFGPTFIIGFIAVSPADTGYFAGAMRIFVALHTFVWIYYLNLLPSFSRAFAEENKSFRELLSGSLKITLLGGLTASIIGIYAAPVLMRVVYGSEFSAGGSALQWLAAACLCAAVSGNYRFGLLAANLQNKEMQTSALGAIMVVGLVPLGYFSWGTTGAAAGVCAAEFGVLFYSWRLARKLLFPIFDRNFRAAEVN